MCAQKLRTLCVCIGVGIFFACEAAESVFSIVLPTEPKPWERTAAKELEACLSQAVGEGAILVGGRLSATADAAREDTRPPVFHVGDTALARKKGLTGLEDERWVVRSFGRDVILNGGGSAAVRMARSMP